LLKKELQLFTFGDLLYYFPFRYVDRTRFYPIRELNAEMPYVQVKGILKEPAMQGQKKKPYLTATVEDSTGRLELVWFKGLKWIRESLKPNQEYVVFGKPGIFNRHLNVVHPEMELSTGLREDAMSVLQTVYGTTEKLKARGIDSRVIAKLQKALQEQLPPSFHETLPESLISKYRLLAGWKRSGSFIFLPIFIRCNARKYRLKFSELFFIQLRLLFQKQSRKEKFAGVNFREVGKLFNDFYTNHLPFQLTNAQKKVIREIRNDCGTGMQMNRLLQGDVGSGKTLVACMTMLLALDNGCQACLMAPTEILATQHARTIGKLLDGLPVEAALLTGSTKAAQRKKESLPVSSIIPSGC
jgi:ATP-dependent DNA helicase RecG